jgi:hypothetical protein
MQHTALEPSKSVKPIVWWAFIAVYVVTSLFVMGRYLYSSNMGDSWRVATLEQMVYGKADRPFVYRQLVPFMLRIVVEVVPYDVQKSVSDSVKENLGDFRIIRTFTDKRPSFQMAVERDGSYFLRVAAAIMVYGFLWLYIVSLYRLTALLFPNNAAMPLCAPIIGLLLIPGLMIPTAYPYDIAALGLFAASCYCILAGKWRWFFVWFVLACINKETALFTIALCAMWCFNRMERNKYYNFITVLFVVFMIIRGVIYWYFRDNEGLFLATSYRYQQFALLTSGYSHRTLLTMFGLFFLLSFRWQDKPLFARYGMVLIALMFGAYFMFGRPNEVRVFLDVMPLAAILMTHTLVECTGISSAACFKTSRMPAATGEDVT